MNAQDEELMQQVREAVVRYRNKDWRYKSFCEERRNFLNQHGTFDKKAHDIALQNVLFINEDNIELFGLIRLIKL